MTTTAVSPDLAISHPEVTIRRSDIWDPSPHHSNGHADTNGHSDVFDNSSPDLSPTEDDDPTRNPSTLFLYTFALTVSLTVSTLLTVYLSLMSTTFAPFWPLPFFLAALSLFHLLEYAVTATYNPSQASTTAFLLNNGKAYNIAHCLAFLECGARLTLKVPSLAGLMGASLKTVLTALGLVLMVLGQGVRTAGMATAGSNFNHIVQSRKQRGHILVTGGVYALLRHPSYFGFFWWGLGTQIVLGNAVCLAGYAVVLWRFFRRRIESEFLQPLAGLDRGRIAVLTGAF